MSPSQPSPSAIKSAPKIVNREMDVVLRWKTFGIERAIPIAASRPHNRRQRRLQQQRSKRAPIDDQIAAVSGPARAHANAGTPSGYSDVLRKTGDYSSRVSRLRVLVNSLSRARCLWDTMAH